jgi:hypothetical protein
MNWNEWHKNYGVSRSFDARLRMVREQIVSMLDECRPGAIRIVSLCAGDGRDVIGAVADHPRRGDVTASLLETKEARLNGARRLPSLPAWISKFGFLKLMQHWLATMSGLLLRI